MGQEDAKATKSVKSELSPNVAKILEKEEEKEKQEFTKQRDHAATILKAAGLDSALAKWVVPKDSIQAVDIDVDVPKEKKSAETLAAEAMAEEMDEVTPDRDAGKEENQENEGAEESEKLEKKDGQKDTKHKHRRKVKNAQSEDEEAQENDKHNSRKGKHQKIPKISEQSQDQKLDSTEKTKDQKVHETHGQNE